MADLAAALTHLRGMREIGEAQLASVRTQIARTRDELTRLVREEEERVALDESLELAIERLE